MYYAFGKELAVIGNRRNPDGPINPRQKKKETISYLLSITVIY